MAQVLLAKILGMFDSGIEQNMLLQKKLPRIAKLFERTGTASPPPARPWASPAYWRKDHAAFGNTQYTRTTPHGSSRPTPALEMRHRVEQSLLLISSIATELSSTALQAVCSAAVELRGGPTGAARVHLFPASHCCRFLNSK